VTITHLLDTSVFSQPIKDRPNSNVIERWSELGDSVICTCSICLAEVLQGLEYRESDKYWRRYRAILMNRYPVLMFDQQVAQTYAKLAAELKRTGKPKPVMDLLIASVAKHHDLTVATLNVRDFEGISSVRIEDWS